MKKSLEVTKYCSADGNFYTFSKSNQNCPFVSGETIEIAEEEIAEVLGFAKGKDEKIYLWYQEFGEPDFKKMGLEETKSKIRFLM